MPAPIAFPPQLAGTVPASPPVPALPPVPPAPALPPLPPPLPPVPALPPLPPVPAVPPLPAAPPVDASPASASWQEATPEDSVQISAAPHGTGASNPSPKLEQAATPFPSHRVCFGSQTSSTQSPMRQ